MKDAKFTRAAIICAAAACALGAAACSKADSSTPVDSSVASRSFDRKGGYKRVVLQAVPAPGSSTSGTMVLYLRPVMKGERLPPLND